MPEEYKGKKGADGFPPLHLCPQCKGYHQGKHQLCEICIEKNKDKEDDYDYAADDFNFRAARERGR